MKVYLSGGNNYNAKLKSPSSYKVTHTETIVANRLVDLTDVGISSLTANNNNYPIVYNSTTGKFVIVDPDTVLSAASTSTGPQPGLPSDFTNTLYKDLDNQIDLDAGSF